MIPRFCIQQSVTSKEATPCSVAQLLSVMRSEQVQSICDQIKLLDGKDPEELAALKRQLPLITPHAQRFINNERKNSQAIPSGLVMLDIDHVDNPRQLWESLSLAPKSDLGIALAHITPSGHGLRIIAERQITNQKSHITNYESIADAQSRLAKALGIDSYDLAPKDLARASFLVPESYILYINPDALEFDSQEQADTVAKLSSFPGALNAPLSSSRAADFSPERALPPHEEINDQMVNGQMVNYRGIPYSEIISHLISILGGEPVQGERNTFYFSLVRYMRYICDFNPATLLHILPDFGLSLEERQGEVQRAVATPRRSSVPDQLLRAINLAQAALDKPDEPDKKSIIAEPPLPKHLPRVLEAICASLPEQFRPAMVIASLPVLGTLATDVRFNYLDHQQHSFSFFSMITGPAATGKSFIRQPVNILLTPIDEQDEIERQKAEEYRQALRASKNKKEQPEDPHACPRNNGINISIAKLLQLMDYANGKHLIGVGEEIDTLLKSERAGSWSQKSDIYRLAFDNAKYGQMYMSDNSYNYNGPVYYNLLLTGTPNGMYRFFHDVEDGLVTRVAFASLPDMRFAQMPEFLPYSKRDKAYIITTAKWLMEQKAVISCPAVDKAIADWLEQKRLQALEAASSALDTLRRRAAVIGFRAGYLAFTLNHYVNRKSIVEFALWVAEYVLQQQMLLFGDKFEDVATKQEEAFAKKGVVQALFTALPQTFTRGEVMKLRAENNQSTDVRMVISRWVKQQLILRNADGTYSKVEHL